MKRCSVKKILGQLPYTAELYWHLVQRHKPWEAHFKLNLLESVLPEAVQQAEEARQQRETGNKVFIFATLHYWIEYAALLGVALAGRGHQVTLSFMPYASWDEPIDRFDLRRQNLYARDVLSPAGRVLKVQSLLNVKPFSKHLPPELEQAVEQVSIFDAQYALQVEDIDKQEPLFQERVKRNREAALNARAWLMTYQPDVVVVPNGSIQEMGMVYQVAQNLGLQTVTFEFSEQRERIWLAQDSEIMKNNTDALWAARGKDALTEAQLNPLRDLYAARVNSKTWQNFTRQWQETATQGSAAVKKALNLDDRPIVLLASNVLGDSLTLGRQKFSDSMKEWVVRTLRYFSDRDDVQLIIRLHPGEQLMHGTSMASIVEKAVGEFPEHFHLVEAQAKVNTYDILDIASLVLVYSTTVGLEAAMVGIPVIVAGKTHYRSRGFTTDPETWEMYFSSLDEKLADLSSARLNQEQVELAWRYAYLFFFAFPKPFPWHLLDLKKDIHTYPMVYVLSDEGEQKYGQTFDALTGVPLTW
ncbi:MAG: hypothetical protein GX142_04955 [Chloroflexi bacterium]|jgi:hypothetical protein|nr:hypothetical protein [Chloroflexota bacterium]